MRSPVSFVVGFAFALQGGTDYPLHRHRAVEIVYHAAGRGCLQLPGQEAVRFTAGDASLCPAGQAHQQLMEHSGTDLCILLTLRAEAGGLPPGVLATASDLSPTLVQEIAQLAEGPRAVSGAQRDELDLRTGAVLAGLLARARPCAPAARSPSLAQDALHYLTTHYAAIASLDEVAAALGVSVSHLRRAFVAHHGESMVRHLNRIRVARAKELLTHSPLSLREIGRRCGFASEQYLCAVFARLEGQPPGAFRSTRRGR